MITDLKQRGVEDILIACIDSLKGFDEAIRTIYPQTEVQTCVVHQIRNSLKYVASKDQKPFMAELKPVYRAASETLALEDMTPDDIGSDDLLFGEGLGLDSVDALELGLALQKRYGITLEPETKNMRKHFATVASLAAFVASHRGA